MQTKLPDELTDTAAKHAAAVERLTKINVDLEQKKGAASLAHQRAFAAQLRLKAEKDKLADAQRELTTALAHGLPVKNLQMEVSGCLANISSLEVLSADAQREATDADKEIYKASAPMGAAQDEVNYRRFLQLTVELAAIITPAIPISRELRTLSHITGSSLEASGYVLNLQRPQIGRYTVSDDGSLSFFLR
jgi:hypothetical protein